MGLYFRQTVMAPGNAALIIYAEADNSIHSIYTAIYSCRWGTIRKWLCSRVGLYSRTGSTRDGVVRDGALFGMGLYLGSGSILGWDLLGVGHYWGSGYIGGGGEEGGSIQGSYVISALQQQSKEECCHGSEDSWKD